MSGPSARGTTRGQISNALFAFCLCLLAILIVMWFRSYRVSDAWTYRHSSAVADGATNVRTFGVWWARGSMVMQYDAWQVFTHALPRRHAVRWMRHPVSTVAEGLVHVNPKQLPLGFMYAGDNVSASSRAIAVPAWLPVLALALSVGWLGRRSYVQRRRNRLGLCPRCGYDLRASEGKCPECGEEIPTPVPPPQNTVDVATPR